MNRRKSVIMNAAAAAATVADRPCRRAILGENGRFAESLVQNGDDSR